MNTGKHTGRFPMDNYIVSDEFTATKIWWENNKKLSLENFKVLYQDLFASADPSHQLNIRLINELAWHAISIRHLLRRPETKDIEKFELNFTISNGPTFRPNSKKYGCRSKTIIAINFEARLILRGGTEYAG